MKSCALKMVSKWCQHVNRVPGNVDFAGLLKNIGSFITYIRTPLMSGIRLARNSVNTGFAGIVVTCYKLS